MIYQTREEMIEHTQSSKRIAASMYSSQRDKVKRILDSIQKANLTETELGNLSIITGLYHIVKKNENEIRKDEPGKIVKFPSGGSF